MATFPAVALALLLVLPPMAVGAEPPAVRYDGGRLSVRASTTPLPDLLGAIGRATGAELRGKPAAAPPVTIVIDDVPVKEALERILGDQSFALVLAKDGRPQAIELRGGPQAAPAHKATLEPPAGWTPSDATVEAAQIVDQWVQGDTRYPVSGRLADALGAREATFSQIVEVGIGDPDRAVRGQALRTSLHLLEANDQVRDAFVRMLGTLDDAFLTNYVRLSMKDNATEIMAGMASRASTPEMRARAQGLLRELRANPTP
jgi:hypothetical protein